jgi:hypothetical protein
MIQYIILRHDAAAEQQAPAPAPGLDASKPWALRHVFAPAWLGGMLRMCCQPLYRTPLQGELAATGYKLPDMTD